MTSAWQALVSKIYKEHKGTMNADGKPFLPKDAMMLAKKVYKKPEGSTEKSTGKRGRKKKGGADPEVPDKLNDVINAVKVAITKGGSRKKGRSKKRGGAPPGDPDVTPSPSSMNDAINAVQGMITRGGSRKKGRSKKRGSKKSRKTRKTKKSRK